VRRDLEAHEGEGHPRPRREKDLEAWGKEPKCPRARRGRDLEARKREGREERGEGGGEEGGEGR